MLPAEPGRGLEALLANLPGMAYRCRNDARCTVLFVSDGCRDLLGFEPQQLFGEDAVNYDELVHAEERDAVRGRIAQALTARRGYELRYRIHTADGQEKWVVDRGRGVYANTGELLIIEGFVSDITEQKRAESTVREHDEMVSLAFRNARDMMLLARVEPGPILRVQSVNRRYLDVVRAAGFMVTAEQLVGCTFSELRALFGFGDATWEPLLRRYRTVVETKQAIHYDEITETPHGLFYGTSTISPIVNEQGVCRFVMYASTDVTSRKRAEEALRESEEKFSKAFRAVPDAVFITEIASGRVVDVNEGCFRLYGYLREECIGRTTKELNLFLDPADRERVMENLQRSGGSLRDLSVPGRRRDGTQMDVMVSCETIELEGRPHLVTIAHDVTARNRAETALRESEAKFAKAFHASPGGMAISEFETKRFVEVSEGYARIFGYTRAEMLGRTGVELKLWASEQDRLNFLAHVEAHGSVRNWEVEARRRDGEAVFVLLSAEMMELGGRRHGITTLYDITSRRRAEEERTALEAQLRQTQKLDALGQLAGGIAHDFNNILTGIGAYTELAVMDIDRPAEAGKHLAQVRRATERATDLVRQILTFSRQTAQERKPTRLPVVVREALKLLRSSMPKSIEISERLEPTVPVVLADASQMHQVMMNLCTNAAHAMRERPGKLSVRLDTLTVTAAVPPVRTDLEPGRYARLLVSDTGHGMDAATLTRIFEPFFTTKAPGEGTGLGLAVVHGIIEDHDGLITARSEPGVGTTFEICLPEHGAIVPEQLAANAELPRGRGERILFVDDELAIVAGVGELLRRIGYQVTTHSDPRAALAAFEKTPADFDAVFTDLAMPRITGIEVARRTVAARPDIPVLLATGHSGGWTPESLRTLGVRRLISKPLTAEKLARALREVLDQAGPTGGLAP